MTAFAAACNVFKQLEDYGVANAQLWYVRRGDAARGPFPEAQVRRYVRLGRIRRGDELSPDGKEWTPLEALAAFAELLAAGSGKILPGDDERASGDRRKASGEDAGTDRRRGDDRRSEESPEVIERRERRARVIRSLRGSHGSDRLPLFVAAGVMAAILLFGYWLAPSARVSKPQCGAPPGPGVNWSNCNLEAARADNADLVNAELRNARLQGASFLGARLNEADVAYADLSFADMSYANLEGADLKGATLRQADLTYANLRGSNLSYADLTGAALGGADLTGARLGNAIWIDKTVCSPGSVGRCLHASPQP